MTQPSSDCESREITPFAGDAVHRKHRRWIIPVSILIVVPSLAMATIAFIVFAIKSTGEMVRVAYASDWTAMFLIEHLRENEGDWPKSWVDLQDEFDRMGASYNYAWTFSELQELVTLQFDLTADDVRNAELPIEVIRLTSGRKVSYDGDPNTNVRDYLRSARDTNY